jgi:Zn ribbon nucleic-acid-binding protein
VSRRDANDRQVSTEVAWCPACQTDRTVEVIVLAGDPGPVAFCVDCGFGVETWWVPELLMTSPEVDGAGGGVRAS